MYERAYYVDAIGRDSQEGYCVIDDIVVYYTSVYDIILLLR